MTDTFQHDVVTRNGAGFSAERLRRIDTEMAEMVERKETPGMVGLIYRHGELAHVTTVGKKDIDNGRAMERDTIFQIMSMTKPITAAAVMTLVDEGRIGLYDSIETVLPELANQTVLRAPEAALDDTEAALRPITLADLLTYRAGFSSAVNPVPGVLSKPVEVAVAGTYDDHWDDGDAWLAAIGKVPREAQPGTRWAYGTASDVLTILVSRISGLPYAQFLDERIFGPLGMKDTGYFVPLEKKDRFATAYQRNLETREVEALGDWFTQYAPPVATSGPAFPKGGYGLASTADDYLTFARMLLGRGAVDGTRILSARAVALMCTNYLTAEQRDLIAEPVNALFKGQGWGLGQAVVVDAARYDETVGMGSPGTFGWPGAFGTWWQADPKEDMIQLYMHNFLTMSPLDIARQRFQNLGYMAIDD